MLDQADALRLTAFELLLKKISDREKKRAFLPHQIYPETGWFIAGNVGGRGCGKTHHLTEHGINHLRKYGEIARVGYGAPTIGAARDVCAEGPAGIITLYGDEFPVYNRSMSEATHINGGRVKFMGAEEPERWRGPQWTLLLVDELASWLQASWDLAKFNVRLPPDPRIIFATTPKPRKFLFDLYSKSRLFDPNSTTVINCASLYDNPHLAENFVREIKKEFEGTRLGDQEILGKFLMDVVGALWSRDDIYNSRRMVDINSLKRIVVAVDPNTGQKSSKFSKKGGIAAETGVAVCGIAADGHGYVLHSEGHRGLPNVWAEAVLHLYDKFKADLIVGETNQGGEMVEHVIRSVRPGFTCFKAVNATRGKWLRADPVATKYVRGLIHHVGEFSVLEDQMVNFTNTEEPEFPIDRLDAMVWAFTELYQLEEKPMNRCYTHDELRILVEAREIEKKGKAVNA